MRCTSVVVVGEGGEERGGGGSRSSSSSIRVFGRRVALLNFNTASPTFRERERVKNVLTSKGIQVGIEGK
jgi:hypothetical protein